MIWHVEKSYIQIKVSKIEWELPTWKTKTRTVSSQFFLEKQLWKIFLLDFENVSSQISEKTNYQTENVWSQLFSFWIFLWYVFIVRLINLSFPVPF